MFGRQTEVSNRSNKDNNNKSSNTKNIHSNMDNHFLVSTDDSPRLATKTYMAAAALIKNNQCDNPCTSWMNLQADFTQSY